MVITMSPASGLAHDGKTILEKSQLLRSKPVLSEPVVDDLANRALLAVGAWDGAEIEHQLD
jgi:hypothetical protein